MRVKGFFFRKHEIHNFYVFHVDIEVQLEVQLSYNTK